MRLVTYSTEFLLKLIIWIFIPILIVVCIAAFMLHNYSKKYKETYDEKYKCKANFYSALLAILIVGALFAIVIGFSITFTSTLRARDLVKGNEIIYYFILITPLIPFTCLVYYIRKMVQSVTTNKKTKKENNNKDVEIL